MNVKPHGASFFSGSFHLKMIIIAGAGFFTDAYDLFSISLLTKLLGRIYFQGTPPESHHPLYTHTHTTSSKTKALSTRNKTHMHIHKLT